MNGFVVEKWTRLVKEGFEGRHDKPINGELPAGGQYGGIEKDRPPGR